MVLVVIILSRSIYILDLPAAFGVHLIVVSICYLFGFYVGCFFRSSATIPEFSRLEFDSVLTASLRNEPTLLLSEQQQEQQ